MSKFTPYAVDELPTIDIDVGGIYFVKQEDDTYIAYIRDNQDTKWLTQKITNELLEEVIDDSVITSDRTWSSFKINEKLRNIREEVKWLGGPQIFPISAIPESVVITVNGQEIGEEQRNINENNIEILDQLQSKDNVIIRYQEKT